MASSVNITKVRFSIALLFVCLIALKIVMEKRFAFRVARLVRFHVKHVSGELSDVHPEHF